MPFHGVSVNNRFLKVTLMFGCFFSILSMICEGTGTGRMMRRCSGFGSGPPPIPIVDANLASRREAVVGAMMGLAGLGRRGSQVG